MNPEDFERLKKYYREISLPENANKLFYNTDRVHNALVMSRIFQQSQEVNMYCGKLSLLGVDFAEKVNKEFTETQINEFSPMDELYESIKHFLSSGKRLTVIVEKDPDEFTESIKLIQLYNNFRLYKISDCNQAEFHFSVGDGVRYRREIDKDSHTAICYFDEKEGAQIMNEQFRYRLTLSTPLN